MGIDLCALPQTSCVKPTTRGKLLYSTGNSAQGPRADLEGWDRELSSGPPADLEGWDRGLRVGGRSELEEIDAYKQLIQFIIQQRTNTTL